MACGDCAPAHPLPETRPLTVILMVVALTVLGGAIFIWQRPRRRPARVTDQWSALAAMGELCPDGWKAEITFHGPGAAPARGAAASGEDLVVVDWKLYEPDSDRVAVERRVLADTIDDALRAMVDDRRLDVALEQIEQSACRGDEDSPL